MLADSGDTAIWCLLTFQIIGLASVYLTRLGPESALTPSGQRLFLGCLALMGLATMGATIIGPGVTLLSGVTFSVMVISAVWDIGPASS